MLRGDVTKNIEEFVYAKPRSIQEIAQHIKKNWRTADRYVVEIEEQLGTLATRVFRSGTRGALKIVYWAAAGDVRHSVFQEQLEQAILSARRKEDFSAFDIYQHIDAKKKTAVVCMNEVDSLCEFRELMTATKQQLLLFSGNLSFINLRRKERDIFETFEILVTKGVSIKILCRVDIVGKENVERLLSLNFKHGNECIEIHHAEQPLRGTIIDGSMIRLKEVKEPTGKLNELNKKLFLYYTMKDKDWAEWLSRIFWKLFSASLDSTKRLQEIKRIPMKA